MNVVNLIVILKSVVDSLKEFIEKTKKTPMTIVIQVNKIEIDVSLHVK